MAEFVAPQFQNPDFLGSYIRGQQSGQSAASFPGAMELQNQQVQSGQLGLQQLQMALKSQQTLQDFAMQNLNGQSSQGGASAGGNSSGGIQNGPQGSVSSQPARTNGDGYSPSDYNGMIPSAAGSQLSPGTMNAIGLLGGNKMLEGIQANQKLQQENRAAQMQVAQMKAAGPLNVMDSVADSPNPSRMVMNNPSILAQWPQIAQHMGFDPVKDFDDQHIRLAALYGGNQIRTQVGIAPRELPTPLVNTPIGTAGEVAQVNALTGKKEGDLVEAQHPTFTLKSVWDPSTGKMKDVPVQTGGYGMSGVGPTGNVVTNGPAGKFPASAAALGFDAGFEAPKDPQLKAAMFGSEMRSGLGTLDKLEGQGLNLSPATRTAFISAATSEDTGALHLLFGQEALVHGITPKEQTYMAALMPMLQAAGHDQSGARLTTSQVRQNLESLVPIDVHNKDALQQVQANRKGFYQGLLTQAGSATQLPQYRTTLGADLKQAQGGNTAPAAALEYLKAHPESASHFKAKFGYLPNGG